MVLDFYAVRHHYGDAYFDLPRVANLTRTRVDQAEDMQGNRARECLCDNDDISALVQSSITRLCNITTHIMTTLTTRPIRRTRADIPMTIDTQR